jgi:hypothetical protein
VPAGEMRSNRVPVVVELAQVLRLRDICSATSKSAFSRLRIQMRFE